MQPKLWNFELKLCSIVAENPIRTYNFFCWFNFADIQSICQRVVQHDSLCQKMYGSVDQGSTILFYQNQILLVFMAGNFINFIVRECKKLMLKLGLIGQAVQAVNYFGAYSHHYSLFHKRQVTHPHPSWRKFSISREGKLCFLMIHPNKA